MAIAWDKIHVGFRLPGKKLFIGRGEVSGDRIKWESISDDRSYEMIMAVATKLKAHMDAENNPDKPYFGYDLKDIGRLVLIKDGFKFDLRPEPRRRQ